jgi:hypothetical protein
VHTHTHTHTKPYQTTATTVILVAFHKDFPYEGASALLISIHSPCFLRLRRWSGLSVSLHPIHNKGCVAGIPLNSCVTELTDIAGVHRTNLVPPLLTPAKGSTLSYHLAGYDKPQPSPGQPAFIYHDGLWLHQLHRPSPHTAVEN